MSNVQTVRQKTGREDSEFLTSMIALVPHLPIDVLSQLAMCVIDAIDDATGDCDLEDCDPAGDHTDEFGECVPEWGVLLPLYGVNQAGGPINARDAEVAYLAACVAEHAGGSRHVHA